MNGSCAECGADKDELGNCPLCARERGCETEGA